METAPPRTRLTLDTTDTMRRALLLRKTMAGETTTVSEIVNGLLRVALADEIAAVGKMLENGVKGGGK